MHLTGQGVWNVLDGVSSHGAGEDVVGFEYTDGARMSGQETGMRYRFGVFEADAATGELWKKGMRVRVHAQPFQVLLLLLERPGQMLSREEIARVLWPDGTFVDYEHGVNSAVNRLREALGDKASSPTFVETLARRGYRFVAPVERVGAEAAADSLEEPVAVGEGGAGFLDRVLAQPEDLPETSYGVARTLFVMLQLMYVGYYVGALANLAEINDLMSPLAYASQLFAAMIVTAALLIPLRVFLVSAVVFKAPRIRDQFLRIWWVLLVMDGLWSLAPFLLLHHINVGFALACTTLLVYSPFAQRSLMLMGAGGDGGVRG
jgi:cholera toxin transcriptional activator